MPVSAAQDSGSKWQALEFSLVVVMLGILGVLVIFILLVPLGPTLPAGVAPTPEVLFAHEKAVLDYRKDILAVIITAFGAWVGAGAAYFFGRENLREAASSMLRMRETSQERLKRYPVRDVPPRRIPWIVKATVAVKDVADRFKTDAKVWFVVVVDDSGKLVDVVHREGVSRYLINDPANTQSIYSTKTVADLLVFLRALPEDERKRYVDIYVTVKPEMSAGEAFDLMQAKDVFIGVIVKDDKPVEFIDTADLRRVLLTMG